MRYKELLLEYNRDITLRQFGDKILVQWKKEQPPDFIPDPDFGPDQQKILLSNVLEWIEMQDPTTNKQYVPWIAREYSKGNIRRLEDIESRIKPALERFHKMKNTRAFQDQIKEIGISQGKDIGRLDAKTFIEMMNGVRDPRERMTDKGESETFYEDDDVTVIVPLDQTAACYYGQDTLWCTAEREGRNYFDSYNKDGKLYIIIPKKPRTPDEKYQLHIESRQFMDKDDNPVNLSVLNRFPGLVNYFKKNIDEFAGLIAFEDPEILRGIHNAALDIIEEQVRDQIKHWGDKDDAYLEILVKEAPDGNGDIDWDKVYRTPELSYEKFDPQSGSLIRKIRSMDHWTIEDIRKELLYRTEGWISWQSYSRFYNNILRDMIDGSRDIHIAPQKEFPNYVRKIAFVGPYTIGANL